MGHFIGCHDETCQLGGEQSCKATSQAGCEAEAAAKCAATTGCVAFSIMGVPPASPKKWVYELAHTTAAVLKGFPDSDWTYFVDTTPWPKPAGPAAEPLGGFQLPNSLSFFVNMATAMASDTSLFKLGMVSLITDPPLFDGKKRNPRVLFETSGFLALVPSLSGEMIVFSRENSQQKPRFSR